MAKVLRTAAIVVGVVALGIATYGASIGATAAGASGSFLGITSIATAGAIASVAAAGLSMLAGAVADKPPPGSASGSRTKFTREGWT